MKTKTLRFLALAGLTFSALAASVPALARDGHRHYGHARPVHHAPHVVIVYRPAPAYHAPAPVYYTTYYPAPAPVYYHPHYSQPAWGAIGGAIAGAAIGSTIGRGNGRIASIAAGSAIGAAVGSQLSTH
jgi:hypothetical protein